MRANVANSAYLDLSVPEMKNKIKSETNAKAFMTMSVKVEEKYDGTKLTLVRNNEPWNEDYSKNWIVAYKGSILYPNEFTNVDRKLIRSSSIGISQYAIVHDILKENNKKMKKIPLSTEFFVEYIMDKPTLTRDYKNKHNLVLLAYSPTKFSVDNGKLVTSSEEWLTKNLGTYSIAMGIRIPNLLFSGKLENLPTGIADEGFRKTYNKYVAGLTKAKSYTDKEALIRQLFTSYESTFGGKPEGVVIKNSKGEIIGKYVAEDQYDKNVRFQKKLRWKMGYEEESAYFEQIKKIAEKLIKDSRMTGDYQNDIGILSELCYTYDLSSIEHLKKDNFKKQDDLYLTAKTMLSKRLKGNNWCVFQGRFQPPTKAHIQIIKDCIDKKGFDGVYIVMVRGKKEVDESPFSDETRLYILKKELAGYEGKYKIKMTDTGLLTKTVPTLDKNINAIVGGSDRKIEYISFAKRLGIRFVEITRESEDVSATKVREALIDKDKSAFTANMGFYDDNLFKKMSLEMAAHFKESCEGVFESLPKYKEIEPANNDFDNLTLAEYVGGV